MSEYLQLLKEALEILDDLQLDEHCWCECGIDNPNYQGRHTATCKQTGRYYQKVVALVEAGR